MSIDEVIDDKMRPTIKKKAGARTFACRDGTRSGEGSGNSNTLEGEGDKRRGTTS